MLHTFVLQTPLCLLTSFSLGLCFKFLRLYTSFFYSLKPSTSVHCPPQLLCVPWFSLCLCSVLKQFISLLFFIMRHYIHFCVMLIKVICAVFRKYGRTHNKKGDTSLLREKYKLWAFGHSTNVCPPPRGTFNC